MSIPHGPEPPKTHRLEPVGDVGERGTLNQSSRKASARDSILTAAMQIIAEKGERAATFRAVAAAAGVSHSLLQHHFGIKQGLIAAVEEMVARRFSAASATTTLDAQLASVELAAAHSELIAGDAHLRRYLRRALLEATPTGQTLFAKIVKLMMGQLSRYGDQKVLPRGSRLAWFAAELVAINLAGVLFEPMLAQTLGEDPFDPRVVAWRTKANRRFIVAALKEYVPSKPKVIVREREKSA